MGCNANKNFNVDYSVATVDENYTTGSGIELKKLYAENYEKLPLKITGTNESSNSFYSAENYVNDLNSEVPYTDNSGSPRINTFNKLYERTFFPMEAYYIYFAGKIQNEKFIGEVYFSEFDNNK